MLTQSLSNRRGVVIDWRERPAYGTAPAGQKPRDDVLRDAGRLAWCDQQKHNLIPEVLFSDGRSVVIDPYIWKIEIDARTTLTRTQLPLGLAWALTIHKVSAEHGV